MCVCVAVWLYALNRAGEMKRESSLSLSLSLSLSFVDYHSRAVRQEAQRLRKFVRLSFVCVPQCTTGRSL